MSTRKSFGQKKVPDRYTPPINDENAKKKTGPSMMTEHQEDNKTTSQRPTDQFNYV
jgi:hypothetical protein